MSFKDFYAEKNKINKEENNVDEMKQKISDMFTNDKSVEEIEKELNVKLKFPKDGDEKKFIISKTYEIVK